MEEQFRKLATIRKIKEIRPIEGADAIELAVVDGWNVVVAKNVGHKVGDKVVYCEIDSFLPIREEFEFLRKTSYKKMGNLEGFRLKTIRLRGQISQGLVLPYSVILSQQGEDKQDLSEGSDVTEMLGVVKYEPPIPAQLSGQVKGGFPGFLRKTDEERIQNLEEQYQRWRSNPELSFYATEKLDGCLDGNTIIMTEIGEMKISEICNSSYRGKILSFDLEKNKYVFKKCLNTFIKPNNNDWYEIELEDGRKIKLTGNHRIWIEDQRCWRRADQLRGDEKIFVKN